jgi:hypothetical protein
LSIFLKNDRIRLGRSPFYAMLYREEDADGWLRKNQDGRNSLRPRSEIEIDRRILRASFDL